MFLLLETQIWDSVEDHWEHWRKQLHLCWPHPAAIQLQVGVSQRQAPPRYKTFDLCWMLQHKCSVWLQSCLWLLQIQSYFDFNEFIISVYTIEKTIVTELAENKKFIMEVAQFFSENRHWSQIFSFVFYIREHQEDIPTQSESLHDVSHTSAIASAILESSGIQHQSNQSRTAAKPFICSDDYIW